MKAQKLPYFQTIYFIDTDLPLILQVFIQAWQKQVPAFREKKSLSHSKFAHLRFWLLLEHPSKSTIFRVEKDSNRFFKIKICI